MPVGIGQLSELLTTVIEGPDWIDLEAQFARAQNIFIVGNGGNLAIAQHACSDIFRLTTKNADAPSNSAEITALITECGVASWLETWLLKRMKNISDFDNTLVIGLSCSNNSTSSLSVTNACEAASRLGAASYLWTSQAKSQMDRSVRQIVLSNSYFHLSELTFMAMVYSLIDSSGVFLPKVADVHENL